MQTVIDIKGEQFEVIHCENQFILHPIIFGIHPVWKDSSPFDFKLNLVLDNYKLSLQTMWIEADCALPIINGNSPKYRIDNGQTGAVYENLDLPVEYTGAILLAHTKVNDYNIKAEQGQPLPCFCYKVVYEYIFEQGILITTIDHSRAMLRIRKNIDLGYRDWKKKRDQRCISQFVKSSLVGDYKKTKMKKLETYLYDMRLLYENNLSITMKQN